jgi:hypothetical protein
MPKANPGELLRRFVLDFLVEEALKEDPMVNGDSRRAMGASFSVEPMVDLGNIRKYRVISTRAGSNRRVYLFLFRRASQDRAFRTTELCFRRCVTLLRGNDASLNENEHDILMREELRRQRSSEDVGLILTEVVANPLDVAAVSPGRFSEIPKCLVDLGLLELYPKGTMDRLHSGGGGVQSGQSVGGAGHRDLEQTKEPQPAASAGDETGEEPKVSQPRPVSVHDWLKRAYLDTFGMEPVHVSTASHNGPVIAIRVLEITEDHDRWAVEVTRHLRVREGSLDLEVQLLEVK